MLILSEKKTKTAYVELFFDIDMCIVYIKQE